MPLVRGGEIVTEEPLSTARERHVRALAELPDEARRMSAGEPVIDTVYVDVAGSRANPYRSSAPNGVA